MKTVFVTGGAGYVGSVLIPKLLNANYHVKVLDWFIYGDDVLSSVQDDERLTQIKGDIRDVELLKREIPGCDAVIHLACISNDPSYELNPELSKSINYDAFIPLVDISKAEGVQRFIYASSSSVYGVKEEPEVTEDLELQPLTDYSKFKALCEEYLLKQMTDEFCCFIVRPATVCGYSPRLRLDLTVNILTNHAINKGKITVFGGKQKRPNIHIEDITDLYVKSLTYPTDKINGQIFNVGYENHSVEQIATMVKDSLGQNVDIVFESTDDNRSYHISSKAIKEALGFEPNHGIEEAVKDLQDAFEDGRIKDPEDQVYHNIRRMQALNIQ